jgi:hypothetical protein
MDGCPACSAPTDPLDRFCGRCGSGLAGIAAIDPGLSRFCRGCGGSLEPDARFCRRCGAQAPDPREDVFAGMSLGNGHEVVSIPEPIADLVAGIPSPSPVTRTPSPQPVAGEARTESIARPTGSAARVSSAARTRTAQSEVDASSAPPAPTAPSTETTARRRRRRSARRAATATIERTPVQRATLVLEPLAPETDEKELEITLSRGAFPWGGTLALLGALAVILSAIVDWGGPFPASLPRDISASWLLDPGAPASGPSLGVVLLVAGTVGALVTLVGMAAPGFTFLRRFMGLATLMVPIAFGLRTIQSLAEGSSMSELPSALGLGVTMAAAGGLLQLAARRQRRGMHA